MEIKNIQALVNLKLAGELLSYNDMRPYLDQVIDDINTQLCAKYPTFSELPVGTSAYTMFPDKYIRSVVVVGAAWYYYTADEEGAPAAAQYYSDYNRNLFLMLRDMVYNVPIEYQADDLQGTIESPFEETSITIDNIMGEY